MDLVPNGQAEQGPSPSSSRGREEHCVTRRRGRGAACNAATGERCAAQQPAGERSGTRCGGGREELSFSSQIPTPSALAHQAPCRRPASERDEEEGGSPTSSPPSASSSPPVPSSCLVGRRCSPLPLSLCHSRKRSGDKGVTSAGVVGTLSIRVPNACQSVGTLSNLYLDECFHLYKLKLYCKEMNPCTIRLAAVRTFVLPREQHLF